MAEFKNQQEYYTYLESHGSFPEGFRSAATSISFIPPERAEPYGMNMAVLLLDEPTESFAALFTQNAVCGVPVIIGRERLKRSRMQAVLVNNRISNVAAEHGMEAAEELCAAAGRVFGIDAGAIFPSSTGIIGWKLPLKEMLAAMDDLQPCDTHNASLVRLARAIMTTDSYPKIRVKNVGAGKIVAVAKGAGMIEPNMGTMLVFIMTDLKVERQDLERILGEAVNASFNAISIDGDQSTSDMVLAFSSRKYDVHLDDFERAFHELCTELSVDIVRNGEGTAHVMKVDAGGHHNSKLCRALAKAVGNSPLVKTAIYGNDPNVGRILSALGDEAGARGHALDISRLSICIGKEVVFRNSVFVLNKEKEDRLAEYLKAQSQNPRITGYPQHDRCVHISIDLAVHSGSPIQQVFASDLGHEYVSENADYRS